MARKTKEQKEVEKLDKEIEQAWYRLASGVGVDIMDIGKVFNDVRAAFKAGSTIDAAVEVAKAKYRKN
jgi:hypothetical protein